LLRSGATPFYWKKKRDVDFVVKGQDNLLTAINVSYTDAIHEREIEGRREFAGEYGDRVKEMIILTKDSEQADDTITIIPLWKWLLREK